MVSLRLTRSDSLVTVVVVTIGFLIHLKDCSGVAGISLAPVYWNLTNPIFKTSKNDHIVVVNLFDEIDFVCPHYPSTITDSHLLEYYLIYRVSKKEYDECNIYSENASFLILRCTHPKQKRRFTILFEPFQSIPNVPEYKAGHTYYFMTPSTGRKNGLRNLYQGACLQHNMKLTIKVRDDEYEVDEVNHRRTNIDSEVEDEEEEELMEYQSQEAGKGLLPSTRSEIESQHFTLTTRTAALSSDVPTARYLANNLADSRHRKQGHPMSEHSPSSSDEVEENFEDFLKSGTELPSFGLTNRASQSTHRPPNGIPAALGLLLSVTLFAFCRFRPIQ